MKYRLHIWTNIQTGNRSYGIQCQQEKGKRYIHCCSVVDGINRALIYKKQGRAIQVMEAFNSGSEIDLKGGLVPLQNN